MPRAVIVMAKGPRPGAVKTRLIPALGAAAAAGLYRAFVGDVLDAVALVPDARRFVFVDPPDAQPWFAEVAGAGFEVRAQSGRSLTERMIAAFAALFAERLGPLVMRNSDSPTLPPERVLEAFDRLARGADVVLGPDLGGGYYLVGLREPRPDLFRGIAAMESGGATVLDETAKRARLLRLELELLPPCLDVDVPSDLELLRRELATTPAAELPACERTRAFLATLDALSPGSGKKFTPEDRVP